MELIKKVLLGSAAGLAAVAVAQAADLPVKAKPVHYVKICTLYGDGYYYIPGTDTCIKFGGYVRAQYGYNVDYNQPQIYGVNGAQDRSRVGSDRRNPYNVHTRGVLNADARTQTAYGTLRTYWNVIWRNQVEAGSIGQHQLTISRAFIQWAGFTFGRTASFVDPAGQLGDAGLRSLHQIQTESTTGASGINQIAYTWQLGNGVTLNIGADEERVRGIHNMDETGGPTPGSNVSGASNGRIGQHMPSPWLALRVNQAWGAASAAVIAQPMRATYYTGGATCPVGFEGTTQCDYPENEWGFGVLTGAEIKTPWIAPGDRVAFYANYAVGAVRFAINNLQSAGLYGSKPHGGNNVAFGWVTDGVYLNDTDIEKTTAWAFGGGFEHYWSRQFSTTWYGTYGRIKYNDTVIDSGEFCAAAAGAAGVFPLDGQSCDPGFAYWAVGSHSDWFPVPRLRFAVDVLYSQVNTAMKGDVHLGSTNGARPTGTYRARNLGITSVIFRAQRNW